MTFDTDIVDKRGIPTKYDHIYAQPVYNYVHKLIMPVENSKTYTHFVIFLVHKRHECDFKL